MMCGRFAATLLCLGLAVAAASASPVPGTPECSKVAEGEPVQAARASAMLALRPSEEAIPRPDLSEMERKSAGHLADSLEQLAVRAAANAADPDETKAALNGVSEEMEKVLNATFINHDEDQSDIDRIRDELGACADLMANISGAASAASDNEMMHDSCRMEELRLAADKALKCNDYKRLVERPSPPDCISTLTAGMTDLSAAEGMLKCVQEVTEWAVPYNQSLKTARKECDAATMMHNKHVQICNEQQTAYEMAFCAYHKELTGTCSLYTSCRMAKEALREDVYNGVRASEAARKSEFAAVKRIQCFMKVLKTDKDDQSDQLAKCTSAKPASTPRLDIKYHPKLDAKSCDITPVSNYPCTPTWLTEHYGAKPWKGAPPEPCTVCSHMATTVTATTTEQYTPPDDGGRWLIQHGRASK